MSLSLDLFEQEHFDLPNWAGHIDEDTLASLGVEVCEDATADAQSRGFPFGRRCRSDP